MMAGYEEVQPGLADRIMTLAEETAAHHREMDSIGIRGGLSLSKNGQLLSAAVTTITVVTAMVTGDATLAGRIAVQIFYILAAIYVLGRLPQWWNAWRQQSPPEPPAEEGADDE